MYLVIIGLLVVLISVALMDYDYSTVGSLVMIIGLAIMASGYRKFKNKE